MAGSKITADTQSIWQLNNMINGFNNGFDAMSKNGVEGSVIQDMKDQINIGYIPPVFRVGSDIEDKNVPSGMGFKDAKEVGTIRFLTSGGTDKQGNERPDLSSMGLGNDFARHLGIDTSRTHFVTEKQEDGTETKADFKDSLKDKMSEELYADTKSVYIMHDYAKKDQSTLTLNITRDYQRGDMVNLRNPRTKHENIPFQDIRITSFVFEKYDGTVSVSAAYTNESGYKIGDVPYVETEGFSFEGKLDIIDDFKDKISTERGLDYGEYKDKIENYAEGKVGEVKEDIYKQQIIKTESQKETRTDLESKYKEAYEIVKGVYNVISARYSEMSVKLTELKDKINDTGIKCIEAEKRGEKDEIEKAKTEYSDAVKEYLSTRDAFSKELPKESLDNLKERLSDYGNKYVSAHESNDRIYGSEGGKFRDTDNQYSTDNKFQYAISTTKNDVLSMTSHDGKYENIDKSLSEAFENGTKRLEDKVAEWNDSHSDRQLSLDEDGIVRDEDGKEFLAFNSDIEESDNEGFIELPDTLAFEFGSPLDSLEDKMKDAGVPFDKDSYRDTIIGYADSDVSQKGISTDDEEDNNQAKSSTVTKELQGIKSERDLYTRDPHVNIQGNVELSDKKKTEILAKVLKEYGVKIDKYEDKKAELKSEVELSSKEMESIKDSVIKNEKGSTKTYQIEYEKRVNDKKDEVNKSEIYSRLGVDINTIKARTLENINKVTLNDKTVGNIEKTAKFESKGDVALERQLVQNYTAKAKEDRAESMARRELGVDNKAYYELRDSLRAETTLPESVLDAIEHQSRDLAGYNEESYKKAINDGIDRAKEDKIQGALDKFFKIDSSAFEKRYTTLTDKAEAAVGKKAEEIKDILGKMDRWKNYGGSLSRNMEYNGYRRKLHEAVNEYIKAGGAVGNDKLVTGEVKLETKYDDLMKYLNSNIIETMVMRAILVHREKMDAKRDKIERKEAEKIEKRMAKYEKAHNDKIAKENEKEEKIERKEENEQDVDKKEKNETETAEEKDTAVTEEDKDINDISEDIEEDKKEDVVEEKEEDKDEAISEDEDKEEDDAVDYKYNDDAIMVDDDEESDDTTADEEASDIANEELNDDEVEEKDDLENKEDDEKEEISSDREDDKDDTDSDKADDIDKHNEDSNEDNVEKAHEEDEDDITNEDADSLDVDEDSVGDEELAKEELEASDMAVGTDEEAAQIDNEESEEQIVSEDLEQEDDTAIDNESDESDESDDSGDGVIAEGKKNDDAAAISEEDEFPIYDETEDVTKDEENADKSSEDDDKDIVNDVKEAINEFLDGNDTLTDNLWDLLNDDDKLSVFDLADTFSDAILEHETSVSPEELAETVDIAAKGAEEFFGELASDFSDNLFDKLEANGFNEELLNDASEAYQGMIEDEIPDLHMEGNVGAADFTDDGNFMNGLEGSNINDIENAVANGIATPETMGDLLNDVEYSRAVDDVANYINDGVTSYLFDSPIENFSMGDAENIAKDIVANSFDQGSDNYFPNDDVIQQALQNYDPSTYDQPDIPEEGPGVDFVKPEEQMSDFEADQTNNDFNDGFENDFNNEGIME